MPLKELKDIQNIDDIKILVDEFYNKVNDDDLLSPVFNNFAKVDWEKHLPNMYSFWNTILLANPGYKGAPFPKHIPLPVGQEHFARWISLFIQTVGENFSGKMADIAKEKAMGIASMFQYKMGITERKIDII